MLIQIPVSSVPIPVFVLLKSESARDREGYERRGEIRLDWKNDEKRASSD